MKFLYVEMIDNEHLWLEANLGVSTASANRRIVRIPLTGEQVEMIKPKLTGGHGVSGPFTEMVNVLCIQDD